MKNITVILGARGSVPVSGPAFLRHGGATICVFLRLAGQPILLDGGSGILCLGDVVSREEREIPLLLSHPHADHLLGFPMCPLVFDQTRQFDVYAMPRGGLDAQQQMGTFMHPPLWPVGPESLPARVNFHELTESFSLGPVTVDIMEGVHPGGVTLFRLTGDGKRVVFATDCTLTEYILPKVTEFARDCDLLLIDGQYSEEEWPTRKNFGHNTWISAAQLGAACGARQVRIIHHDPARTDEALGNASGQLLAIHPNCTFAREGEEITL